MRLWLCSLLLLATPAFSTTVPVLSVEQIAARAEVVVHARVEGATTRMIGSRIVTVVQLRVIEQLQGALSSTERERIEVVVPGGVFEGRAQIVHGAPSLEMGQGWVLFLGNQAGGRVPGNETARSIVGLFLGAHRVAKGVLLPGSAHADPSLIPANLRELRTRLRPR